jgi:hypothetical protein
MPRLIVLIWVTVSVLYWDTGVLGLETILTLHGPIFPLAGALAR